MMFIWIIDHLQEIFALLVLWIFLSVAFCVTWHLTRKAWIIRHPVWEEGDPQWTDTELRNLRKN